LAAAALRLRGSFVLRFFAGFCLIANGAYIAAGSFVRIGDSGQMIRHGSPPWQLWLFGALAVPVGLALWHRQGTHFGLGKSGGRVSPGIAYLSLAMCLALIALGFIVDGRSPKSGDEPTAARTISGEPLLQAKASPGIVLASLFTVVAPGDNGRRAGEDGRRMSSAAISPRKPVQKGVQGSLQKCSAQANLVSRRLSRIDNPWWRLHPGQFLLSSQ